MFAQEYKTLNNGVKMPVLGLGVYKSGADTKQAVLDALEIGYRHIDTAAFYKNEEQVGEAIRESGIPREEIFATTKCWCDDLKNHRQREAFETSLKRLGLDYVDLYLMHWPVDSTLEESWQVLEQIYQEGKARAIGVSNCYPQYLERVLAVAQVIPAVNQVEAHPYLSQQPLKEICQRQGIAMEAWSPLGRGGVLHDPVIESMANKYGKTQAQIILRWEVQEGWIVIPKSVHKERIQENAQIFDFALTQEDLKTIEGLNQDKHFGTTVESMAAKDWVI